MLLDTIVMLLVFLSLILVICRANRSAMAIGVIALIVIIIRLLLWTPKDPQQSSNSQCLIAKAKRKLYEERTRRSPKVPKALAQRTVVDGGEKGSIRGLGMPAPPTHRAPPKLPTSKDIFDTMTTKYKAGHHKRVDWDAPQFAAWRAAVPQETKAARAMWDFHSSAQRVEPEGYRARARASLTKFAEFHSDNVNPYLREIKDK